MIARGRIWRRSAILLCAAWAAFPAAAAAGTTGLGESAVCTMSLSVTISPGASVVPPAISAPSYTIGGQGFCSGGSTTSISLSGGGATAVDTTCEAVIGMQGVVQVNTTGTVPETYYPVYIDIAGSTVSPTLAFSYGTPPGSIDGSGQLVLTPSSLDQCAVGGTPSLQYTGAVVLAG